MNYFFFNLFRKTSSINLLLGGSFFLLGGSCYSLYRNVYCNLLNNNNLNNKNNELNKLLIKNNNLNNNLNNNKKIDDETKMDEYRLFRNNE